MPDGLEYPDSTIPSLRFRYCPMCRGGLSWKVLFDDGIERASCEDCGWIHTLKNALGVVSVLVEGENLVAIQPPGEDGVALPAGLVEYGEAPEQAALREIHEETGLRAEILRLLGWEYRTALKWPGPQVLFMYEARVVGGGLSGSEEGPAQYYPIASFPKLISSTREGSQAAIRAFLEKRDAEHEVSSKAPG